jgi:hypothetical protein
MAYPLSNFHTALRIILGDEGSTATGYDYSTEQLDRAVSAVICMGFVPSLAIDAQTGGLVAAPANPDTWGYLVAKAAHLLVGGITPTSFRTRALSVTVEAAGRRDTLSHIEAMVSEIDARGNVGGLVTDTEHKGLFGTVEDVITRCRLGHHHHHSDPHITP